MLAIKLLKKSILKNETGGAAIILVVWVMVILLAIVGEFSFSMRTEVNIIRNFKEEEQAYQLALAGIETAKIEIMQTSNETDSVFVNEEGILIFDEEIELERNGKIGNGTFEYTINDEDGKLNINKATIPQMQYVFKATGVESSDVDTIVDSIEDWKDINDLHHLNGAEEDYYRSLSTPYSCKDSNFDSIEELLLVKGMIPEILYGSKSNEEENEEEDEFEGIRQYLTVFDTGLININTASNLVLEAVLGVDAANSIMVQRAEGLVPTHSGTGKITSSYFTVLSTGKNADGTIKRTVKAVLHKNNEKLETVYWSDNVIG